MTPVRPGEGSWKGPILRFCTFRWPWWGLEGGTKELILRPFRTWRRPLFKAVNPCCTNIWILKEPWAGVVRLFEFWKNYGLVLYGYLNFERTTVWCYTVIWILKEPRVGVVRLFGFWKNHGLVLYGYLNFERTMGWCCTVIWILKEPRVGVVWLFEFWPNHRLVLYGYLKFERTMGPSCLQKPMVL
jgi:hypothetical protein